MASGRGQALKRESVKMRLLGSSERVDGVNYMRVREMSEGKPHESREHLKKTWGS